MRRGAKPGKAKVKARLPVARKSRKSEGSKRRELEKRLAEALQREQVLVEQQTATAEILSVISSSPTDVQPVFDTITQNALELCGAASSLLTTFDGELLHLAALANVRPGVADSLRRVYPMRPGRGAAGARAILTRAVVHIPDLREDPEYALRDLVQALDFRSVLAVPMLREGKPIGTINVHKGDPEPFSESQIALLQTFAAQAVIAIENVRLFTELQQKNGALTQAHAQVSEALEQQTATAEILRVISSSPTDGQPVFDVIVESACRLCDAVFANAVQFDGELMHNMAHYGFSPEGRDILMRAFPRAPTRESMSGRAILEGAVVQSEDMSTDEGTALSHQLSRVVGAHAYLSVPMLKEGVPVGAITVARRERGSFPARQVELLKTFADQAVIAIENVRLFTELGARNRELTEALEQQTATAEILRVISQSQTDVQPVFDTIVRSAVKLCDGLFSGLNQFDGELLHFVAGYNYTREALAEVHRVYPARPTRALGAGRAILERAVVHMPDVEVDPEYQHHAMARAIGFRSGLHVPRLREVAHIGVILVARAEPGPFSDNEIELLKTFADQAVIAVENVRLFKEVQARTRELTQSVEKLTALGEVSRAVSSTLDVETVLDTIVSRASQLAGAAGCSIYEYDESAEQL